MPKRRKLLLLLLCVVSGGALIVLFARNKQPTYQGTSLSEWVGIYSMATRYSGFRKTGAAQKDKAANAIRHIGTNALPLLFTLIDHPEPGLWRRGGALWGRLPEWTPAGVAAHWLRQHHPVILRPEDAISISQALGPIAAPAIPELLQRLSSRNWTGRRDLAKVALAYTGPEALANTAPRYIPILLTDSNEWVRMEATNALLKATPESFTNATPP